MTRPRFAFQYAVLRAVPRVDRGEFVNVGVIIYCQQVQFLRAAVAIDEVRLRALAPDVDVEAIQTAAEAIVAACREDVGIGPGERRTGHPVRHAHRPPQHVLQPSPIHAGMTHNPERALADLMGRLVGPPRS